MRILLVHNEYQEYGGEDVAVASEEALLLAKGHVVSKTIFKNAVLGGGLGLLKFLLGFIYNIESARRIRREIELFRPDVMHVHNLFYVASPSILTQAFKLGIPVVMTLHNYRIICSGGLLARSGKPCELCVHSKFPIYGIRYKCHRDSLMGSLYLTFSMGLHKMAGTWRKRVTTFITMTEFGKGRFVNSSMGVSGNSFTIKSNSVTDRGEGNAQERDNLFLFVGRLTAEKGVGVLKSAFENNGYELEIIGDGPMRSQVVAFTEQNKRVRYLGFLSRDEIMAKLKHVKALIVPSLWYEGLPTTILEAFSAGTPIIVSDIGNLNEIVTDGYNGFCFDPGNFHSLNEAMDRMMSDRLKYLSLCAQARLTYVKKYTPEANLKSLEEVYIAAIEKRERNKGFS